MAAYAALVSLMHVIDNLSRHCRPPISFHKEQAHPLTKTNKLISSLKGLLSCKPISLHKEQANPISLQKEQVHLLTEKITSLQEFLEVYNPNINYNNEADPLESSIARAAYAAEDAIESHIFYLFNNKYGEKISSEGLYEALEKVIQDMSLIEKETMEIKETGGFQNQLQAKSTELQAKSTAPTDPTTSSLISQKKSSMVGADDLLLEMKDKLTFGHPDLQTIPIVGMGGSGKTTLALNLFQDRLIQEHFDIRAWVTISQQHNIVEILEQVLSQLNEETRGRDGEGEGEGEGERVRERGGELGEILHKRLYGIRYMIILDDMWSLEAWDGVRRFLPNNKKGSRIIITTRLATLASALPNSNIFGMKLLDENDSWNLLSKTVFGVKGCPPKFEDIGKMIGKSCKGLPLSIVVVGGLLAKSEQTIEYWVHVNENLNTIVNLDDGERCLKTLYMSYKQLPVHLKPCFLYMGIYREDYVIRVPNLVKLWVAEGFLKPMSGKSLEDAAREYLKELISRNLIMVHKLGSIGSIKECKIHDLLRDLCLREARKQGFYIVYPGHDIDDKVSRIVMSGIDTIPAIEGIDASSSAAPLARSLILDTVQKTVPPHIFWLMRTFIHSDYREYIRDSQHKFVNLRCSTLKLEGNMFPSLIWQFWNLRTLHVRKFHFERVIVPSDIWYMSQIRNLHFRELYLPDPPKARDGIALANLQSLGIVNNFKCSKRVVKRIPNIRKLKICYDKKRVDDKFCLNKLDCLEKLESLEINLSFSTLKCLINYPQSLKKLSLEVHSSQCWQGILDKIGELPLLQKLTLHCGTFEGQWETSEGQFRSLKYFSLIECSGMQVWTSEASHFPRLEQLRLYRLSDLAEIPSDFADLSTLGLIKLYFCSNSVVESAKRILEEQEALYGEEETTLQVKVKLRKTNRTAAKSSSPNFHVTVYS